jgi:pilus assembly protein CpaC
VFTDHNVTSRSIVVRSTVALFVAALAITLTSAPALAQRAASGERIEINVGDQETVSAANVQSYSVGVENVADVRLTADGRTFVIVGQHAGETSLLLIYADGHQVRYTIVVRDHATVARTGEVVARDNIRLDLYFVQLSQTYDHAIGIGWPGTIGGSAQISLQLDLTPASGPAFQQATASLLQQALPRLDLAQSAGWARLIRQGMLVTANGEEASINTGGEINFLVTTGFAAEIRRIEFGTVIRMQPHYDPDTRRIEITIGADVSELTAAGSAGVPGRLRTQLQTIVNMELGQSIVLGGLVSRSTTETQGGLPGLSQIPILGVLFGTNVRREEHVENFLFVVPTVVQSVPRSQADRITEALHVYEGFGSIGGHGLGDIELIEPSPPGFE